MRDIDLRRLRYFTVLAEILHFGRAAELLHISQPGLSAEIRRLETQLGVALFSRSPRTALTPAGETLLTEAEAVLAGADRFASVAGVLSSGQAGVVSIGSTASVLEDGLLEAVATLAEEAPDLRVLLEEMSSAESTAALRTGGIDLACGNAAADGPDVSSTRLSSAPFVLVRPAAPSAACPLPRASLTLSECADLPFSVFRRSASPRFHDTVRALCAEAGFEPRFTHRSRTWRSALDAVAAGLCVSVAPEPIARAHAARESNLIIAEVVASEHRAESWISRRAEGPSVLIDRVEAAITSGIRDVARS